MDHINLLSPAKLNLRLKVLGKRKDGYHNISTLMVPVSLYDEIRISLARQGSSFFCEGPDLPQPQDNLAWIAASSLLSKKENKTGITINIKKRIPVGAGLGGGSSNAATTLIGINQLLKLKLTTRQLMEIGAKLGADVPFFVFGSAALASGIGDQIKKFDFFPKLWFVIIKPDIFISTAWAYNKLNIELTKKRNNIKIPFRIENISEIVNLLSNDLEGAVIPQYREIEEIKIELIKRGAKGSLMSGSGSAVFGIFLKKGDARKVFNQLRALSSKKKWKIFLAHNF